MRIYAVLMQFESIPLYFTKIKFLQVTKITEKHLGKITYILDSWARYAILLR